MRERTVVRLTHCGLVWFLVLEPFQWSGLL